MKWFSWVLLVSICTLVVAALGYYKFAEIEAAMAMAEAFPEPRESVEVHQVRAIERTPSLTVSGEVVAIRSADLRAELPGRIASVDFAPGAAVQAGQVLVQLDVTQEQAQLAEARADLEIARLALQRAERLVQSGAGSVDARDQARARAAAAEARVGALDAVIAKKTLRAPFDGVAGLHELEAGQFLDGGTVVTRLVGSGAEVWVDFSLPQEHSQVIIGSVVDVLLENGQRLQAEVIARDATVNVRSRNLRLRASLERQTGAPGVLLPGMLVEVEVELGTTLMATVVPATAVRRDAFGASVYVLEDVVESGQQRVRARKRAVQLGQVEDLDQSADVAVVLSGLNPGERIAAVGAFKLRDGSLVVPQEPDPEAAGRLVGH